ncbi:hypothetical protein C9374_012277 [Naegleria lovaniensis]|uniref:Uncharacterized protein n=1 Tax=Naegleria lovaniensis TaxID=51637 RepID=A0AA88GEB6_NAELO|nr:uncharacterized protein C9374_012277 [Naegleria lovaniensis]KAG2373288.1 hypothetical protein C9374_012277 [Naegleria lovaniensis]
MSVNEQTPGQRFLVKVSQKLSKERFEHAFGVDQVAEWDVEWSVFENTNHDVLQEQEFEDISIRKNIRTLAKTISKKRSENMNTTQKECFLDVLDLKEQYIMMAYDRIEAYSAEYFKLLHPESNICFGLKKGGDQLGVVMNITTGPRNEQPLRYYIKTHALGRKEFNSSTVPKPVEPLELIVYKVLEKLQLCPQVHFICRDEKDLLIATLDAGQNGDFQEFSTIMKQPEKITCQVWGNLLEYYFEGNGLLASFNEEVLNEKAHKFIEQLSMMDMIMRIFNLRDCINNTTNFGFMIPDGDLKVIDFRAELEPFTEECFKDFRNGNGMFRVDRAHYSIIYPLFGRPWKKRLQTAMLLVQEGMLCNLSEVLKESVDFVITQFSNNDLSHLVSKVKDRHTLLQTNIDTFIRYLNEQKLKQ